LGHDADGAIVVLAPAIKVRHSQLEMFEDERRWSKTNCGAKADHFANFRIVHFGAGAHSTLGTSPFDMVKSNAIYEVNRE
jgi:hypothetical protein